MTDGDNRISRVELVELVRTLRSWFPLWRAHKALAVADSNGDGVIDKNEMDELVKALQKWLGINISISLLMVVNTVLVLYAFLKEPI
ncbi:hypothetical protein AMTRI_Chr04g185420 [Amborella trichopoda]